MEQGYALTADAVRKLASTVKRVQGEPHFARYTPVPRDKTVQGTHHNFTRLTSTSITSGIAHGTNVGVTPDSMLGIFLGATLTVTDGVNTEAVVVTKVTVDQFFATFTNSYTGPVTVTSASASGLWCGVWCQYDPATNTFTDQANCWVADANNANLTTGVYYWGRQEGASQGVTTYVTDTSGNDGVTVEQVTGGMPVDPVTTIQFGDGFAVTGGTPTAVVNFGMTFSDDFASNVTGINNLAIVADGTGADLITSPSAGNAVLTLSPASPSNSGLMSPFSQNFGGGKGFNDGLTVAPGSGLVQITLIDQITTVNGEAFLTVDGTGVASWTGVNLTGDLTATLMLDPNTNRATFSLDSSIPSALPPGIDIHDNNTGVTHSGSTATVGGLGFFGGLYTSGSLAVGVSEGGTGQTTLSAHAVLLGEGSSGISSVSLSDGELLIGQASADPVALPGSGTDGYVLTYDSMSNPVIKWAPSGGGSLAIGDAVGGGGTPGDGLYVDASGNLGQSPLTINTVLLGEGTLGFGSLSLSKGELLVGQTGADPVALATSTDGYVLTLNSGVTDGVEWAAPSGGGIAIGDAVGSSSADFILALDGSGNLAQIDPNPTMSSAGYVLTSNGVGAATFQVPAIKQGVTSYLPVVSTSYGHILALDGSDNVTDIDPSTAGYVLTSNGSGSICTFQPITISLGTLTYSPGNAGNWVASAPADVQDALDRIAAAFAANSLMLP